MRRRKEKQEKERGKDGRRGGEEGRRKAGKLTWCGLRRWALMEHPFFFFFFFLRAASAVYGGSLARGQIRAAEADLGHSHSNEGF